MTPNRGRGRDQAADAQIFESTPSRPRRYHLARIADAGSVPCSASRDKWPKRWTLGQNKGHLFRLPNGIAPFSILLPHKLMPARHMTRDDRFRLWLDDLRHRFLYTTSNAVRQFPLQDGLQRKTQVPDQQQMWDALALSLDSVGEQVRR